MENLHPNSLVRGLPQNFVVDVIEAAGEGAGERRTSMRMGVNEFLSMSERMVCALAAPAYPNVASNEKVCLLTMDEIPNLDHVAVASDGRTYEAVALHRWLCTQTLAREYHVIPDCPITHVSLMPEAWLRVGLVALHRRLARPVAKRGRALLKCGGALVQRVCRRALRRRRPRPSVFLSVVRNCDERRHRGMRNVRRIVPSANSAFVTLRST